MDLGRRLSAQGRVRPRAVVNGHRSFRICGLPKFPWWTGSDGFGDQPA